MFDVAKTKKRTSVEKVIENVGSCATFIKRFTQFYLRAACQK